MYNFFKKIYRKFFISDLERLAIEWNKIDGDRTLRLDYDFLNQESTVFDLGGYLGQWASDIFSKYQCYIYVFEPSPKFFEKIRLRFKFNNKIKIYPYGLSSKSESLYLSDEGASSSLYKNSKNKYLIKLINFNDFLIESKIKEIDLIKINIEGGEYQLLEHLIQTKTINKINQLQVQFHDFIPDARKKLSVLRDQLSQTHELTWHYNFLWENWVLKERKEIMAI